MIYDRARNCYYEEKQFGGAFLRLLYSGALKPVRPLFLREGFSELAYSMVEKGYGPRRIEKLMAKAGIDGSKFQGYPFRDFTEFFLRRYRKEALPPLKAGEVISPSDGKVRTYQVAEDLKVRIKGRPYSVAELLGGSESARLFAGGRLFLIRLSLDDCHRFIYTESGSFSGRPFQRIPGLLHTVSEYSGKAPVLKENERRYSLLETGHGMVLVMEVGSCWWGASATIAPKRPGAALSGAGSSPAAPPSSSSTRKTSCARTWTSSRRPWPAMRSGSAWANASAPTSDRSREGSAFQARHCP